MKKFQFQLQSALDWRKRHMEAEQTRLEALERQRADLATMLTSLEESWLASTEALRAEKVIEAGELETLCNFRLAADRQKRRIAHDMQTLSIKLSEQRTRLVEATRQYRLIEKLRERRLDEWQRGVDAQLEQEAGELYLAQWINQE